ncbi:MAG: SUMF1/EgtB/PvdO family nonheme iron enzyme [Bacteroidota bacterium]
MRQKVDWVFVQGGPTGDFRISKTEITFAQYDEFCNATGYTKPGDNNWGRGKRPVINVNVADAKAFCAWLSKETGKGIRLPEENEWEFAAKGGKKSNGYIYSGSNKLDDVGWYAGNSEFKTHEVDTKKSNELGIYDMSGNVWEWCGDSGAIRGGCWHDNDRYCRISGRFDNNPDVRSSYIGFRILQK